MMLSSSKLILSALVAPALCVMQFSLTNPHTAAMAADSGNPAKSTSIPLPDPPAAGGAATSSGTPAPSGVLATMWKACYELENNAEALLQQGKNWYPRKDWLTYYTSNIEQYVGLLEQESNKTVLPADAQAAIGDQWSQIKPLVADMRTQLTAMTTAIGDIPDQVPESQAGVPSYPAGTFKFHDPAAKIDDGANKLNKLLIEISHKLGEVSGASAPPQNTVIATNPSTGNSSGGSAGTTLKGSAQVLRADVGTKLIAEAAKKIQDSSNGLLQELERWNLLWGQPPAGGTPNIMYGGGLTPAEVLTQYYYLPSFAFTEPGYLRFSYRLPPRQKFLVIYTTQIGKMINLMASEIEDTKFPPEMQVAVSGPWGEVQSIFNDMVSNYMELLKLVNESSDDRLKKDIREDQMEFGKPTIAIHDDMSKLTKVLADVKSVIQQ